MKDASNGQHQSLVDYKCKHGKERRTRVHNFTSLKDSISLSLTNYVHKEFLKMLTT